MSRNVKIAAGKKDIQLPNGRTYQAGNVVTLTDEEFAKLSATALAGGSTIIDLGEDIQGAHVISIPVTLATVPAGAGDVVTSLPLKGNGKIVAFSYVSTAGSVGAGATRTFNMEIGTTNLTGGVLTVTLANSDVVGEVVNATAITANNSFEEGNLLSIEVATGGTAFTGGEGVFLITVT